MQAQLSDQLLQTGLLLRELIVGAVSYTHLKSTTYTVLKKLGERGLVQNEESVVTALASRETVTAEAAEAFVDKTFNGSLPGFLAAFMGGRKLTEREAEDLKRLIDQYQEG